jgi:hypothetical protein
MNTNKTGIMNVKKNVDGVLSTLFKIKPDPKLKDQSIKIILGKLKTCDLGQKRIESLQRQRF